MLKNKYSKWLTVLLIVLIVAIMGLIGYFVYDLFIKTEKNNRAEEAMTEFSSANQKTGRRNTTNTNTNTSTNTNITNPLENFTNTPDTNTTNNSNPNRKKTYYEGYEVLGNINIPKTKCKYPVLSEVTKHSLEVAVAVLYPTNLEALNMPGNTVIAGHNFRNGLFFSDNKKLSKGDKIILEGATETVTYAIYEIFETTPSDADYMVRDTNGKREISLSTCTDDSSARLIILAREQEQ